MSRIDPARQVVLVLARDQQHLGDDARPASATRPRPGSAITCDVGAEAVAHHAHHLGGIVLGRRQRLAVEGREAAADVEDAQARGRPRPPRSRARARRRARIAHIARLAHLAAGVERDAGDVEPEEAAEVHQPQRLAPRAAELAAERPVGLAGLDEHADDHPRAGGVRGDLARAPPRRRRRTARRPRACAWAMSAARLMVLPKAMRSAATPSAEAEVDLAARGAVEPAAERRHRRHHLGRRVGLDRVVDGRVAEALRRARGTSPAAARGRRSPSAGRTRAPRM